MIHVIINILLFISIAGLVYLCYLIHEENEMENKPKIYFHENMIDIDLEPMSEEYIAKLVEMSFAWQPDMTHSHLRMYGSEGMLWGLIADIKEIYPDYHVVMVA